MAIVVLVLWAFTAGAGFYLLISGHFSRPVPAGPAAAPVPVGYVPPRATSPAASVPASASASRDPWAPPSLVASRQAPIVPGARALAEFAHPAAGIIGLGFWLGFTLIHARVLGWIGFGMAAATACAGLAWFTANNRAARAAAESGSAASFPARLVALHGSAAAATIALAALTALLLRP